MDNNTFIKLGGRLVAVVRGRVLDIRRHKNGFLYTPDQPPAISIAQAVLHQARQAKVIQVTNLDNEAVYSITMEDFNRWSYEIQNDGYEVQRACAISHWAYSPPYGQKAPQRIEVKPAPKPEARQLGMFGG